MGMRAGFEEWSLILVCVRVGKRNLITEQQPRLDVCLCVWLIDVLSVNTSVPPVGKVQLGILI